MLVRKSVLLLMVGGFSQLLFSQGTSEKLINNDPFAGGVITDIATGQSKKIISLQECFQSSNNPQPPPSFRWKGESAFTLISNDTLWEYSLIKFNQTLSSKLALISKDSFIALLSAAIKTPVNKSVRFPLITWTSAKNGWFIYNNSIINIWERNEVNSSIPSFKLTLNSRFAFDDGYLPYQTKKFDVVAEEISENNLWLAFIGNDNLYVQQLEGWTEADKSTGKYAATVYQVTEDGGNGIVYGQSVHQNEFGISKGLFWGKQGKKLAFYRMDERRVPQYPLFDISKRPAQPEKFRYPMAGDSSHTVTVGIFDPLSKKLVYIKSEGSYDQYLTNLTFTPDEKFLYISWVNREQNRMELRKYSTENGLLASTDLVLTHPKYVEPENGPIFLPNSNTNFILEHEGSGFNHLYLFEFSAGISTPKVTPLTSGPWEVTQFLGFTETGKAFIYQSTANSPLDRNYYYGTFPDSKAKNKGKSIETKHWNITGGEIQNGTNTGFLSLGGKYLAVYHTSLNTPMKLVVLHTEPKANAGTGLVELYTAKNPLDKYTLGEIKLQKQNFNGVDLYSRTILPYNFDANKKYPVVVYVYGGPHAQMVTNSWLGGGSLWMHFMASRGYVVYTIDNRGSSHRGLDFESETHRKLGEVEMQDQLAALRWLKQQSWVDSSRVGVHGWSFGGFMTTSLMTRASGNYKVGVAGGPVINWNYYEIMYTERYMDKPQENPDGFYTNNLVDQAKNLKNRLLMIHGADDNVVVWQHSLMFLNACVKSGNANLDYFVYPGHKHNVVGPDRAHLYKKVCQYFFDHL
jgi:dipeptidyl-peptidase-4